jgi:diguanylate cyclase (GGDEF)-like protein/PAS domain S-box-containing protein
LDGPAVPWAALGAAVAVIALFGLFVFGFRRALSNSSRSMNLRRESERLQSEVALARAEARFRTVFEGAPLGIALIDADGTIRESNAAFDTMLGFPRRALIGRPIAALIDPEDRVAELDRFGRLVRGEVISTQHEVRYRRENGSTMWADVSLTYIPEDDAPFAIVIVDDVSERVVIRERLIHEATHDPLTGLPNRGYFTTQLGEALARRPPGLALAFVDLDHFKVVNDSMGHLAGDALLRSVAQRLRSIMRPGEIVARLGGDEFAALFIDEDIEPRIEWLLATVAEPAIVEGRRLYTTASVGVVVAREGYHRPDELLRDADIALYRSKADGRATYTIFDEEMHAQAVRKMQISSDVRDAINAPNQFLVAFQPLVRLADGKTTGYEALVRWNHPREGLLQPDVFVPAAEENGSVVKLGRYVLARALERLAFERRAHPTLQMHVNVSVQELMQGELPEHVFAAIRLAGVPPEALTLEITEYAIVDTGTGAAAVLGQLRDGGVRICVDDFGIGYSSLRYLRSLPISGLKIDRSFISGNGPSLASEPIVRMVLDLARSLDLDVVAEGVETPEQVEQLLDLGCSIGQGYYYSRPLLVPANAPLVAPSLVAPG